MDQVFSGSACVNIRTYGINYGLLLRIKAYGLAVFNL